MGLGWSNIAAVFAALSLVFPAAHLQAQTVPGGTQIQLRLRQTLSSFGSRLDNEVSAIVIAPVVVDGAIVIPLGAEIVGIVEDVRRVGLGFARESAWIDVDFNALRLPGDRLIDLTGKIVGVDNSRETIDVKGRIKGIRATASWSSVISGVALSAAAFDPMLLAFGLASSLSIFRIPESEIVLPVGTEIHFQTTQPLTLNKTFPPAVSGFPDRNAQLDTIIRDLPYRTATEDANLPSDLTNLAFLGTEQAIRAAFDAAGWSVTDVRDARSSYGAMRSIIENQGYKEAPMSTLLLGGKPPAITYAKTLNTFFQRHHLRVFSSGSTFADQPLWTASSTHDSGIGFAVGQKAFIHLIDQNIDQERDKVVNDLILTGCVTAVEWIPRAWVPLDASNSTGDRLTTDGRIALLRLNDCNSPARADAPAPGSEEVGTRPNLPGRAARNTLLTLRNDMLRGNLGYQGYQGITMGAKFARGRKAKKNPAAELSSFNYAGQTWKLVPGAQKLSQLPNAPRDPGERKPGFHVGANPENRATFLEFSISGGYSRFGNSLFSTQPFTLNVHLPDGSAVPLPGGFIMSLRPGWNLTGNATFNGHKYYSHELGFTFNTSKLETDIAIPPSPTFPDKQGAQVRQFHYALLLHARPNGARLRPYLALGGGMQVIRLTDSPEKSNPYLRFAFKELNVLYSAFRFAGDPPLEGGGIIQPTLHYGGGVKYHLTRRVVLRADFRETLSEQPDFWTKSQPFLRRQVLTNGDTIIPGNLIKTSAVLRQQRASIGIGIAF